MRIASDVDGVHVDWNQGFAEEIIAITGRNLFTEGVQNPPVWQWPEHYGYTKKDIAATWKRVCKSPIWWENLGSLPGCRAWDTVVQALEDFHDVYYVTARSGHRVKRQTERWISEEYNYEDEQRRPTVLIVKPHTRGDVIASLEIDAYIDDNLDNAIDVSLKSPTTRVYLLNYRHNQDPRAFSRITRVDSVQEFIDRELVNIQRR